MPEEQVAFILERISAGDVDREIVAAYKTRFQKTLSKSALGRWRRSAGAELADRFRFVRAQAKELLTELKAEPGADKHKLLWDHLEDHLLSAASKVASADPVVILKLQLQDSKRKQADKKLELAREKLDLERERLRGSAVDRYALGLEFTKDLLEFIGADAEGLRWFKRVAKGFEAHLKQKYAES